MTQAAALTLLGVVELLVVAAFLLALLYPRYRRLRGAVALEAGRKAALLQFLDAGGLAPGEGGTAVAPQAPGAPGGDGNRLDLRDDLKRILGSADPYDRAAWGALLQRVAGAPGQSPTGAIEPSQASPPAGLEPSPDAAESAGEEASGYEVVADLGEAWAGADPATGQPPAEDPSGDWRTLKSLDELRGQVERLNGDKDHLVNELRRERETVRQGEDALRALQARYEALQREYLAVFHGSALEEPAGPTG